ncbi:MAG: IS4 family transposase [Chitinophagales bacterium]|jgi:hypothetical protein
MNKSTNYFGQHLFSQIANLCNRSILQPIIDRTGANYSYKKLFAYEHFIAMQYAVLAGCTSIREIVAGLGLAQGKLNHLNINYVPPRSTLSDGNKNRNSDFFKQVYEYLYKIYKPNISDSSIPKAVLQNLFLMDSTVFGLFKAILKTTGRYSQNGKVKGGIKKNTILNGSTLMPHFIQFTPAAENDQSLYHKLSLPSGSFLVFDKGYNNYAQFTLLTAKKIYFITRQKYNAAYKPLFECWHGDETPDNVLKEELIEHIYKNESGQDISLRLRRIAWYDSKQDRTYEFITNNLTLDAATIAALYKYRWKIELFFKKLKQNFPLQYFVGDNQNAIEIQIWSALIALLLLSVIHSQHKTKMAFSVFTTIVKLHLFSYMSINNLITTYSPVNKKKAVPDLFNSS